MNFISFLKSFSSARINTRGLAHLIIFRECMKGSNRLTIFILFSIPINPGGYIMPRGDKSSYTDKQKRQASHIEEGYEKNGVSKEEAERRAWATENKISGGGKKSGSAKDSKKS
jgi:hypothetical protein